ncbi:MAG: hypothetical protein NC311_10100 [Muribaculaceae bacterium]|nr:hypothetical protein [Muribaculaceae bacterium]
MRLYLDGRTNLRDLKIDYIELELPGGGAVSLNWDESEFGIDENGIFNARYKGVYYGEEYANGRIGELEGAKFSGLGWYSDAPQDENTDFFEITGFEVLDSDESGRERAWELPGLPVKLSLKDQDFTG